MTDRPHNMDFPAISAVVNELTPALKGGRLFRATSGGSGELILEIDTEDRRRLNLLLSSDPMMSRIHIVETPSGAAKTEQHHLANVLNTRTRGSTIVDIRLEEWERVISFHFLSRDIDGSEQKDTLIAELMGKHSNVILIDDSGMIIASQRTVHSHQSSVRQVRAGLAYHPPPPEDKLTPKPFVFEDFKSLFTEKGESTPQKTLIRSLKGMSPAWGRFIVSEAGLAEEIVCGDLDDDQLTGLHKAYIESLQRIDSGMVLDVFPPEGDLPINNAYAGFYSDLGGDKTLGKRKSALLRITRDLKKSSTRLSSRLEKDMEACIRRDELKRKADAILSALHEIPQSARKVELVDVHSPDGEKLIIELDPSSKPSKQAEKMYERYNKLKRGESENRKRLGATRARIQLLDEISEEIEIADNIDSLTSSAARLEAAGVEVSFDRSGRISQRPSEKTYKILKYLSSDGFEIFAGGNQKANDYLTHRYANGNDIWLHAKEMPGSHVIIRTRKKDVPSSTLNEAANIAAWHSEGKEGSKVPVDYTRIKQVRKPPGAKPGYVTYKKQRTIRVDPDEEKLNRLQAIKK